MSKWKTYRAIVEVRLPKAVTSEKHIVRMVEEAINNTYPFGYIHRGVFKVKAFKRVMNSHTQYEGKWWNREER